MTITKKSLIAFYLEYFNDYLTVTNMAEHYEMPEEDCRYLIALGKKYNDELHQLKDKKVTSNIKNKYDL